MAGSVCQAEALDGGQLGVDERRDLRGPPAEELAGVGGVAGTSHATRQSACSYSNSTRAAVGTIHRLRTLAGSTATNSRWKVVSSSRTRARA